MRRSSDVGAATGRRVERRVGLPSSRAAVGGLLVAVAAVLTFSAYAGADADDRVEVLIATRPLTAGQVLRASDVELVAVDLPAGVRGLFGTVDAAVGREVVAPVGDGEFLQESSTAVAVDGSESLEVAVTLPTGRAVGRLSAGERVDVFSTWGSDVTELIVVGARVVEVSTGPSSPLGTSEEMLVRLQLADFGQVEALVHAQAAGDLTMVRAAIGSETGAVGRQYRPLTGTSGDEDGS